MRSGKSFCIEVGSYEAIKTFGDNTILTPMLNCIKFVNFVHTIYKTLITLMFVITHATQDSVAEEDKAGQPKAKYSAIHKLQ